MRSMFALSVGREFLLEYTYEPVAIGRAKTRLLVDGKESPGSTICRPHPAVTACSRKACKWAAAGGHRFRNNINSVLTRSPVKCRWWKCAPTRAPSYAQKAFATWAIQTEKPNLPDAKTAFSGLIHNTHCRL